MKRFIAAIFAFLAFVAVAHADGLSTTPGQRLHQGGKINLRLGGTNADLSSTGGTSQVLQQSSAGAKVTVGQLACANLSNSAATCSSAAESGLTFTDITTNNSSTSNHGFLKKLDNTATHYMDGTGAWSTPTAGAGYTRTQLAQNTTTGGTTMSVTSLATGHKDLEVVASGISGTAGTREWGLEVSAGGSGFGQTFIDFQGFQGGATSLTSGAAGKIVCEKSAGGGYTITAAQTATTVLRIQDYTSSQFKNFTVTYSDTAGQSLFCYGMIRTTSAIDGAQVYMVSVSGTIDAGTLTANGLD